MIVGVCRDRWTREVRLVPPTMVPYLVQSPVVGWARCVRVVWRRHPGCVGVPVMEVARG